MTTSVTLTSKGQLTLPAEIRTQLNLKAGDQLEVSFDTKQKKIAMTKPMSLQEVQAMNQAFIKKQAVSLKNYKSGDGWRRHIKQKHEL